MYTPKPPPPPFPPPSLLAPRSLLTRRPHRGLACPTTTMVRVVHIPACAFGVCWCWCVCRPPKALFGPVFLCSELGQLLLRPRAPHEAPSLETDALIAGWLWHLSEDGRLRTSCLSTWLYTWGLVHLVGLVGWVGLLTALLFAALRGLPRGMSVCLWVSDPTLPPTRSSPPSTRMTTWTSCGG